MPRGTGFDASAVVAALASGQIDFNTALNDITDINLRAGAPDPGQFALEFLRGQGFDFSTPTPPATAPPPSAPPVSPGFPGGLGGANDPFLVIQRVTDLVRRGLISTQDAIAQLAEAFQGQGFGPEDSVQQANILFGSIVGDPTAGQPASPPVGGSPAGPQPWPGSGPSAGFPGGPGGPNDPSLPWPGSGPSAGFPGGPGGPNDPSLPFNPVSAEDLRQRAFSKQDQGLQFTRFLNELAGGQALSGPVRTGLQAQGNRLSQFFPLLTAGQGQETSQAGTAFLQFLRSRGGRTPSSQELASALGEVVSVLQQPAETPLNPRQSGLFGLFGNPTDGNAGQAQLGILQDFLASTSAPALRGAVTRGAQRSFEQQQASTPEVPFLQFAQSQGFF